MIQWIARRVRGFKLGQLYAGLSSQLLSGFKKTQVLIVHQKTDRVTTFFAAEAVVVALVRVDVERGRLFFVKWAATLKAFAAGF